MINENYRETFQQTKRVPVSNDGEMHFHLIQPAKIFAKVFVILQKNMKGCCSFVFIVDPTDQPPLEEEPVIP